MKKENNWFKLDVITMIYCLFLCFTATAWGFTPEQEEKIITKIQAAINIASYDAFARDLADKVRLQLNDDTLFSIINEEPLQAIDINVINALINKMNHDAAGKLWAILKKNGKINIQTCINFMILARNTHDFAWTQDIFSLAQQLDKNNVYTGTIYIDTAGRCSMYNEALRVFNSMTIKNSFTYSAMMTASLRTGEINKLKEVSEEAMKIYSYDIVIINQYLDQLVLDGRIDEAIKLYNKYYPKQMVDYHGLSFGAAYIATHLSALSLKPGKMILINIGRGAHSEDEHVVKRAIELYASQHPKHLRIKIHHPDFMLSIERLHVTQDYDNNLIRRCSISYTTTIDDINNSHWQLNNPDLNSTAKQESKEKIEETKEERSLIKPTAKKDDLTKTKRKCKPKKKSKKGDSDDEALDKAILENTVNEPAQRSKDTMDINPLLGFIENNETPITTINKLIVEFPEKNHDLFRLSYKKGRNLDTYIAYLNSLIKQKDLETAVTVLDLLLAFESFAQDDAVRNQIVDIFHCILIEMLNSTSKKSKYKKAAYNMDTSNKVSSIFTKIHSKWWDTNITYNLIQELIFTNSLNSTAFIENDGYMYTCALEKHLTVNVNSDNANSDYFIDHPVPLIGKINIDRPDFFLDYLEIWLLSSYIAQGESFNKIYTGNNSLKQIINKHLIKNGLINHHACDLWIQAAKKSTLKDIKWLIQIKKNYDEAVRNLIKTAASAIKENRFLGQIIHIKLSIALLRKHLSIDDYEQLIKESGTKNHEIIDSIESFFCCHLDVFDISKMLVPKIEANELSQEEFIRILEKYLFTKTTKPYSSEKTEWLLRKLFATALNVGNKTIYKILHSYRERYLDPLASASTTASTVALNTALPQAPTTLPTATLKLDIVKSFIINNPFAKEIIDLLDVAESFKVSAAMLKQLDYLDDILERSEAMDQAIKTIEEASRIGPPAKCLQIAMAKQLELLNHRHIGEIPYGTALHDSLRLHVQNQGGQNFTDRAWTGDETAITLNDADDKLEMAEAMKQSIKTAEESRRIGPSNIPGWILEDVPGDGNCFYRAVAKQLELLNHRYIREIPYGTALHDSLRLHVQNQGGQNFTDRAWTGDETAIKALAKELNVIIGIVDTRYWQNPVLIYYYINNEINDLNSTRYIEDLPTARPVIRLAFTGVHYLSVISTPNDMIPTATASTVDLHNTTEHTTSTTLQIPSMIPGIDATAPLHQRPTAIINSRE